MSKQQTTKPKPIAVIINDVHYNITTLPVADAAMRMAIDKANGLSVPLIVAGDLHDTKANLRAECVNAMIKTLGLLKVKAYILRGNHDQLNEKSKEHSLEFLKSLLMVTIVDVSLGAVISDDNDHVIFLPYCSDPNEFKKELAGWTSIGMLKKDTAGIYLICHQGLTSSNSGEYIQDKSAINPQDVAGMRVISGHYHTRQDIPLPDGGLWTYTGNPYTLNFAEANDPNKGFHVLMDDGSLEFIPTNLRKHRVITCGWDDRHGLFWGPIMKIKENDIVWIKVEGTKAQLMSVNKDWLRAQFTIPGDFRLDLIPVDTAIQTPAKKQLTQAQLLDDVIDRVDGLEDKRKRRLKQLWKDME